MALTRSLALWMACLPQLVCAERQSLFDPGTFSAQSGPLMPMAATPAPTAQAASLFVGSSKGTMFAPVPKRPKLSRPALGLSPNATPAQKILNVVAKAEAGRSGYDAVQYGAVKRPSKAPTDMTVGEIYQWIAATPGQPHAIGRYQFIPATLRRLVKGLDVPRTARFSPQLQDQLAGVLLEEAGLSAALSGQISRKAFMNNLARVWAGLPNSSGKSHYHGYAGNKATMSWSEFDAQMKRILPG